LWVWAPWLALLPGALAPGRAVETGLDLEHRVALPWHSGRRLTACWVSLWPMHFPEAGCLGLPCAPLPQTLAWDLLPAGASPASSLPFRSRGLALLAQPANLGIFPAPRVPWIGSPAWAVLFQARAQMCMRCSLGGVPCDHYRITLLMLHGGWLIRCASPTGCVGDLPHENTYWRYFPFRSHCMQNWLPINLPCEQKQTVWQLSALWRCSDDAKAWQPAVLHLGTVNGGGRLALFADRCFQLCAPWSCSSQN